MDVDTSALSAALSELSRKADDATRDAAKAGADLISARTVVKLSEKSHPPGTPTPSAPGEPPAMISGDLAASMRTTAVTQVGHEFTVETGPTEVYARIQELGGTTGRGATLPARPYLGPALEESRSEVQDLITEAWKNILR